MKVLVAYASRHGSTAGIAERLAAGLRAGGLDAEALPVGEVTEVGAYDAFVIGAASYMFHWLKDATRFVERHRGLLAQRPVWLFASGPLGTDQVDDEGRDVREATRPREFDELHPLVHPRGEEVFFGAWDPDDPPVGFTERLVRHLPAYDATPAGDFRDWPAIDVWADEIARELHARERRRGRLLRYLPRCARARGEATGRRCPALLDGPARRLDARRRPDRHLLIHRPGWPIDERELVRDPTPELRAPQRGHPRGEPGTVPRRRDHADDVERDRRPAARPDAR